MDSSTGEIATLAGGCFWCIEAVFEKLRGVIKAESGYSGGTVGNPTYDEVSDGRTGHAEVVKISFDPKTISYRDLLNILFTIHDPTTLNRQGNDIGPQYRSAIFYHNQEQKEIAEKVIKELDTEKRWERPLVTEVTQFKSFFKAEEYHQRYFERNPAQPYCRVIIAPKVAKFRKSYFEKLKKPPRG